MYVLFDNPCQEGIVRDKSKPLALPYFLRLRLLKRPRGLPAGIGCIDPQAAIVCGIEFLSGTPGTPGHAASSTQGGLDLTTSDRRPDNLGSPTSRVTLGAYKKVLKRLSVT